MISLHQVCCYWTKRQHSFFVFKVHHKTEFGSNLTGHGFPDPGHLDNVLEELRAQGIEEDDGLMEKWKDKQEGGDIHVRAVKWVAERTRSRGRKIWPNHENMRSRRPRTETHSLCQHLKGVQGDIWGYTRRFQASTSTEARGSLRKLRYRKKSPVEHEEAMKPAAGIMTLMVLGTKQLGTKSGQVRMNQY